MMPAIVNGDGLMGMTLFMKDDAQSQKDRAEGGTVEETGQVSHKRQ